MLGQEDYETSLNLTHAIQRTHKKNKTSFKRVNNKNKWRCLTSIQVNYHLAFQKLGFLEGHPKKDLVKVCKSFIIKQFDIQKINLTRCLPGIFPNSSLIVTNLPLSLNILKNHAFTKSFMTTKIYLIHSFCIKINRHPLQKLTLFTSL